jgi:6-phosphogluconolactonase
MVRHTVFLGSYTSERGPTPQTNYYPANQIGPSSSEGIYRATFDDVTGEVSRLALAAEVNVSPSWLQWHSTLPVVYATNSTFDGSASSVTAFRVMPDESLNLLGRVCTDGGSACHCSVHKSGRFLAVAHHGLPPQVDRGLSGSVAILSLAADGTPLERVEFVPHHTETDPALLAHPGRKDWTTHAHSANFDISGKWLFVCEKGADRVIVYAFDDESGALRPHAECMVPIGNAARHLAVHPDGKHIYIDEETGVMVTAHDWDAAAGVLTRMQTLPTLPEGLKGSTSECELGPDGKVLYVANRCGPDSSIATFAVGAGGRLSPRGRAPCGDHPRFFQVDPSGRWLLVNAMGNHAVTVLPLDAEGVPSPVGPASVFACGFPASHVLFLDRARLGGPSL